MTQPARAWVGFLVAPAVPAVLLYFWGLYRGYADAAVVAPGLLVTFGYLGALVIGWPTFLMLQRRGSHSLGAYLVLGAVIGIVVVVVMSAAQALLSGNARQYASAQFWVTIRFAAIAAIYAVISSVVFWFIAVRRPSDQ